MGDKQSRSWRNESSREDRENRVDEHGCSERTDDTAERTSDEKDMLEHSRKHWQMILEERSEARICYRRDVASTVADTRVRWTYLLDRDINAMKKLCSIGESLVNELPRVSNFGNRQRETERTCMDTS